MPERLVLYGTLRRESTDFLRFGLDYRLSFLGPCKVEGTLHDLGSFPGFRRGNGTVHGELYEVLDTDVFTDLDAYEGVGEDPPLYNRVRVQTGPSSKPAWIYEYASAPPADSVIDSGDWSAR